MSNTILFESAHCAQHILDYYAFVRIIVTITIGMCRNMLWLHLKIVNVKFSRWHHRIINADFIYVGRVFLFVCCCVYFLIKFYICLFAAKKQNGAALRTNSLGTGARTPPLERKSRLSALGRLFKPWKWKRKKKSDKFEAASRCKRTKSILFFQVCRECSPVHSRRTLIYQLHT